MSDSRATILEYNDRVLRGEIVSSRWIFAAARRFEADLARTDLTMDWPSVDAIAEHFAGLSLVGEDSGLAFDLRPWQLWVCAQLWGWRREDGLRRVQLGVLQVARGNGKTTLAAGLALFDMASGKGRRVHILANAEEQARICLDTARTMLHRVEGHEYAVLHDRIEHRENDCSMTALPALERNLDGLNPSMWVADEAAEFKGRFLTKLLTTGAKRRESLGLVITTPGSNPESIYGELVTQAEAILRGEITDDTVMPLLFGLDPSDQVDDEAAWPKANPGMEYGQPDSRSIARAWNRMKSSSVGRSEFARYHAARTDENTGGWLDMGLFPQPSTLDLESLRGRPAWLGLDLSKSLDMTALVVAIPLDDGRVCVRGNYWWPSADVRQRELDYRLPVRSWAAEKRITLTPGREVDYEAVRARITQLMLEYDVRCVGYDAWGSKYLVEQLVADGVPMTAYRMGISTFGPGCQLWQNLWAGGQLVINDDPIMRRACATAITQVDRNGNIRPIKPHGNSIIDPLVAGIIAVHTWGGKRATSYD